MLYIIDANNLSGKLGLLGEDGFDKILIDRLKAYFAGKSPKVFLIFDSVDPMGDRYVEDNFEIIRTPRDDFYDGADDKVLEIVLGYLSDDDFKEEIDVITDDVELAEKLKAAIAYHTKRNRVKVARSTEFADKMDAKVESLLLADLTDKTAAENDSDDLNAELLKIWGKNDREM